jgi:hypothetical protein
VYWEDLHVAGDIKNLFIIVNELYSFGELCVMKRKVTSWLSILNHNSQILSNLNTLRFNIQNCVQLGTFKQVSQSKFCFIYPWYK